MCVCVYSALVCVGVYVYVRRYYAFHIMFSHWLAGWLVVNDMIPLCAMQSKEHNHFITWCVSDEHTEQHQTQLKEESQIRRSEWIQKAKEGADEIQLKRYNPTYNLPKSLI